jgi:hypothetical protein
MAGALSAIPALSAITVAATALAAEIETEEDYLPFRIMREWERRNPMPSVDEIATDVETRWSLRLFDYPGKIPIVP